MAVPMNAITRLRTHLASLPDTELQQVLARAELSLDSAIHLTEYEDGKASRLLSAMAFLSATAGILYSALVPKDEHGCVAHPVWPRELRDAPLALFHGLFVSYVILVVVGAGVTVLGIRPKFNLPKSWKRRSAAGDPPKSRIFAVEIAKADLESWCKTFHRRTNDLMVDYAVDAVHEAHLVSGKVVSKLRFLRTGAWAMIIAMVALFFWFASVAVMLFSRQLT